METYGAVLVAHVAAGFVSLTSGATAFAAAKGGPLHRRAGAVFFWAMLGVGGSGLALSLMRPNRFLFLVGAFTLYVVFAGRRAARVGVAGVGPADRAAAVAMILIGAAMVGWGALDLRHRAITTGAVLVVFGVLGAGLALQDVMVFRARRETEPERIVRHLGRMTGGLIAATTAFVVVNADALPELARWLGPTALGVPTILYWGRRVKRAAAGARSG